MSTTSNDKKRDKLAKLIQDFEFRKAHTFMLEEFEKKDLVRSLYLITEEVTGVLSYTFLNYIIQKENTAENHFTASSIVFGALENLPNAHLASLYHITEAIRLAPDNWEYKEYALNFYSEGLLSIEEAKPYAEEVLKHAPHNNTAKSIVEI